jgi:ribosomal protein RSM22 (predicted rRNA methylase)
VAKQADLGFEDEKFSYAAISRAPTGRAEARVIRRPQVRPGHVVLALCTRDGLETVTVGRSDRERFKRARKTAWGDSFAAP